MNVAGVRRMTKTPRKDYLLNLPEQIVTSRCFCGWYCKNVRESDRARVFEAHKKNGRHTRWLMLKAEREAWEKANPGRKWAS